MSDDVKARAHQLLDSITPAPWVWQTNDKGYPQQIVANDDGLVLVAETYTGPEHPAAEAEFIAAAPELVRELLAALERAEAERDQAVLLRAELSEMTMSRAEMADELQRLVKWRDGLDDYKADLRAAETENTRLRAVIAEVEKLLPADHLRNGGWIGTEELSFALGGGE